MTIYTVLTCYFHLASLPNLEIIKKKYRKYYSNNTKPILTSQ